nr:MAG TPA: hypothetical protein [Caudoviricetes sp.]
MACVLESCICKIYSFRNLNSPYNNQNLKVQNSILFS